MRLRPVLIVLLVLTLAACASPRRGGGGGGGGAGPGTDLVTGLSIEKITINQGVEVQLTDGSQNAPVIAGRDGIVRVYVETDGDWDDRDVVGSLVITEDGEETHVYETDRHVDGDSSETQLSSTINFEIDGDAITTDAHITVSLHEDEDDEGGHGGSASGAAWDDPVDLEARDPGGPLTIAFVPVQYNADGSGRLPDISDAQVARYQERMQRLYPAAEVIVDVQDPVSWSGYIGPFGEGWSDVLNGLIDYRWSNNFDDDVYVYGAFSPASSYGTFCSSGCVAGLSIRVESASDADFRVSVGLGFSGEDVTETMAHEVGHAHGREHAPCGLGGQPSDPSYPYSGAALGVPGYDIVNGNLVQPNSNFDVMSYCPPTWVSDYTFEELFDRIVAVNAMASVTGGEATAWRTAIVDPDGTIRPTDGRLETLLPPGKDAGLVEVLDEDGEVVDVVEGRFAPFDHLDGGILLVPDTADSVGSLRFLP